MKNAISLQFDNKHIAVSELKKMYPVPQQHHKADEAIRVAKDFFILRKALEADVPIFQYPVVIEYSGSKNGWPDFIINDKENRFFVEATELTDTNSQRLFQGKADLDETGILGQIDLTAAFQRCIEAKNKKIEKYIQCTGISNSVLLVDHNAWPPFAYGSCGDILHKDKLSSSFDHTFLLIEVEGSPSPYLRVCWSPANSYVQNN